MPNDVENYLTVRGSKARVQQFRQGNFRRTPEGEEVLDLALSFPIPSSIESDQKRMEWCEKNWGADGAYGQMQVNEEELPDGTVELDVGFDTAWEPPKAWVRKVASRYPALEIELKYVEPNGCYCGILRCKGRTVLSYEEHAYGDSDNNDTARAFLKENFPDTYRYFRANELGIDADEMGDSDDS